MRKWLYISIIVNSVSTFAYLYLTPITVLLYDILFGISGMITHLILMNFMAQICPEGVEASVFALLCSVVNFGSFLSNIVGGACYSFLGYNGLVLLSGSFTIICLGFIPFLQIRNNVVQEKV